MKRILHTPGILLLIACAIFCDLMEWDSAAEWLHKELVWLDEYIEQ